MTNFEFWKDTLAEIVKTGDDIAIVKGKPRQCTGINCNECERNNMCVEADLIKWLLSEHIEKPKLTKKERMFCELVETGWIARDADRRIWIFLKKPPKSDFGWSEIGHSMSHIFKDVNPFSFIKREDEEPWSVEDLLKLEVE